MIIIQNYRSPLDLINYRSNSRFIGDSNTIPIIMLTTASESLRNEMLLSNYRNFNYSNFDIINAKTRSTGFSGMNSPLPMLDRPPVNWDTCTCHCACQTYLLFFSDSFNNEALPHVNWLQTVIWLGITYTYINEK